MMNSELYRIAAKACRQVYEKNIDLGTTEFNISIASAKDEAVQVLAIAGSNELKDWGINFNLLSWKGIKYGAYKAAHEVHEHFVREPDCPLLVTGHSKAGPTAIAFKKLFGADYCVAFAPARSLRYWHNRKMENTTLFIDPDDPVSKVGFLNFGHPICEKYTLDDDHSGLHVKDHHIDHFVRYTEKMP